MEITRRQALAGAGALALGAASTRAWGATSSRAWGAVAADPFAALREAADRAVVSGDVPGVVSLAWHKGRIVHIHTVGLRDHARMAPMVRSAIFPLASMGKPVTSALALRLMEQGKLRLEDPITRWLPEFAEMRVLRRSDGPLDDTYPAPRAITVEDLMTHRSGLTYGFTSPGPLGGTLMREIGFGLESALTPDAWLAKLASLPLACAPGERFEYGHSTDVLGFLVGRAGGGPLQQVLQSELLEPLGMADTGFWLPPAKRDRLVTNTLSTALGVFDPASPPSFTAPAAPAYASGGQGLLSTADDYLTFARMLVRGGETGRGRLLKSDTVRLMTTNRLTPEERARPFQGMALFQNNGFGLGVSVVMDAERHARVRAGSAGAFGWPGAFGSWWQADPARDMVLLWLQACIPNPPQAGPPPRIPGANATVAFERAAYAALD